MRDDFLSADWAERHQDMSHGIHRLIKLIGESFEVLTAVQFGAPWKKSQDNKCG